MKESPPDGNGIPINSGTSAHISGPNDDEMQNNSSFTNSNNNPAQSMQNYEPAGGVGHQQNSNCQGNGHQSQQESNIVQMLPSDEHYD